MPKDSLPPRDFDTLEKLLGVPLYLEAATQTGVPALALDVRLSYELRRAGFNHDAVCGRVRTTPRIVPRPVANLIDSARRSSGQLPRPVTFAVPTRCYCF